MRVETPSTREAAVSFRTCAGRQQQSSVASSTTRKRTPTAPPTAFSRSVRAGASLRAEARSGMGRRSAEGSSRKQKSAGFVPGTPVLAFLSRAAGAKSFASGRGKAEARLVPVPTSSYPARSACGFLAVGSWLLRRSSRKARGAPTLTGTRFFAGFDPGGGRGASSAHSGRLRRGTREAEEGMPEEGRERVRERGTTGNDPSPDSGSIRIEYRKGTILTFRPVLLSSGIARSARRPSATRRDRFPETREFGSHARVEVAPSPRREISCSWTNSWSSKSARGRKIVGGRV